MTVNEYNLHHILEDDIPFFFYILLYYLCEKYDVMIISKTNKNKNKKCVGGNCFDHINLILIIFHVMHILFKNGKTYFVFKWYGFVCHFVYKMPYSNTLWSV